VCVFSILIVNSSVYALDLSEAYLSLFNSSSDKIVLDNPGNLFRVSYRNDSGNSTTTVIKLSETSDIFIGNQISGTSAAYSSVVLGNNANPNNPGSGITAIGSVSLGNLNSNGSWNTAIGQYSGQSLTSGTSNVFVGNDTGAGSAWSGINNVFVGGTVASSISENSELNYNVFIGGETITYQTLNSGDYNIVIGGQKNLPDPSGSYQLNIGNILYGINISGTQYNISPGKIGVGSTTPIGRLSVQANDGETNLKLFVIASSTSSTNSTLYVVDNVGHHIFGGNIPSVSSCGTGASIQGNDNRGRITAGSGNVTSCTLTFVDSWQNAPVCIVTQESGTHRDFKASPNTTSVTFTTSGNIGSNTFTYSCDGF